MLYPDGLNAASSSQGSPAKNAKSPIKAAAEDNTLILGCNTIGHLAAGLAHINRTGDDTSGKEWERVRKYGVNTLAFRMLHHGAFYEADADCAALTSELDGSLAAE